MRETLTSAKVYEVIQQHGCDIEVADLSKQLHISTELLSSYLRVLEAFSKIVVADGRVMPPDGDTRKSM